MAELIDKMNEFTQEISRIKSKIGDSERELGRLRAFVETWHELAGTPPSALDTHAAFLSEFLDTEPKKIRPRNPDRELVVNSALEIIIERGKPQTRRELFDALTERGIEILGKDPEMVLSTMLWRSKDQIVRLPPHGYWPKDRIYRPALYEPELEDVFGSVADEPEGGMLIDEID